MLAGLGMTAVRELIALNATRAALAGLAVAGERERLARELHDLLGRTLSLIAVRPSWRAGSAQGATGPPTPSSRTYNGMRGRQYATSARRLHEHWHEHGRGAEF